MKWELKEDSAAYKYLKLNCKPEIFDRRRMWLELKAENELPPDSEWRSVSVKISSEDSVSGYELEVEAKSKDFR